MNRWQQLRRHPALMRRFALIAVLLIGLPPGAAFAQFTAGSDGSDGAFNPTVDTLVDMAAHPDGVFQYTSVNVPAGVTVTFNPNAANTSVTWLVQTTVVIDGIVSLSGGSADAGNGPGRGGPGGFAGGRPAMATPGGADPGPGGGPGGSGVTVGTELGGGGASYGSLAFNDVGRQHPRGQVYGNAFLLPLIGGSGGSGSSSNDSVDGGAGGGGGGAILIAADGSITISGSLLSNGGDGFNSAVGEKDGGGGTGGAIRLLAPLIGVSGTVSANGGINPTDTGWRAGLGRLRFDGDVVDFTGASRTGVASQGSLGIVMLPQNTGPTLNISTVGGIAVTIPATGNFYPLTPNVDLPGTILNPVDVVVEAFNIPLGTTITLVLRPTIGGVTTFTGTNDTGTESASSVTIQATLPAGDGTLHATATVATPKSGGLAKASLRETGLAPNGERFASVEISAGLGGRQQAVYITESGTRYPFPAGG